LDRSIQTECTEIAERITELEQQLGLDVAKVDSALRWAARGVRRFAVAEEAAERAIHARCQMRYTAYLFSCEPAQELRNELGEAFFERNTRTPFFQLFVERHWLNTVDKSQWDRVEAESDAFLMVLAYRYVWTRDGLAEVFERVQRRMNDDEWSAFYRYCIRTFEDAAHREIWSVYQAGKSESRSRVQEIPDLMVSIA